MGSYDIYWNWTDFCPTGLKPFAGDSNDLLPCFQEIVLQIPIYTIFAAVSSYKFGSHTCAVLRDSRQLRALYARILFTIILAILPVWKIFQFFHDGVALTAVDVLVVSAECVMWAVHCGYLLSARRYGELSHRGPLIMNVIWLAVFVLDVVWLRTSLTYDWWPWSLATLFFDILYGLTLVPKGQAILLTPRYSIDREDESLLPAHRYTYFQFELNEAHLGHAQDDANLASRFVFHWVEPLISKGVAGALKKIDDLFDLPDSLNIDRISDRLQRSISQTKNLFWALHQAFGREFYAIGILRFVGDIASFAGPLLLGGLLRQESTHNGDTDGIFNPKPYYYAIGLLGSTLTSALCCTHFSWRMSIIGMKMRIGVVNAIYRKALEARGLRESRPEILNLMSTDTDRIVNSCISFHSFWSIPFQLFATLYLLYTQLGVGFLAGVMFAAALIPLNRWLANRIGIYSRGLMTAKDARLAATAEVINGAKQIKLHAWEDVFIQKIRALRREEVKYLRKRKYLDAVCVYFWATTPVLMCLLTFGVSVLLGNPLVAATTYTSVALLNMLIGPLNAFPWVLNGLVEAWISVKRLQELMNLPNLDLSSYYDPIIRGSNTNIVSKLDDKPVILQLKDATFVHGTMDGSTDISQQFCLDKVNLTIRKGDLVCIEGPVGGGKSSLIAGIAAGIHRTGGDICINDLTSGFGYVSQTPWLQRGTLRDNIVWGSAFDEQWYKSVVHACALIEDIQTLGGDLLNVGENGHALSGGQRARVSLARAVYKDKKIYLLDDILASVDAHVSNHIVKYCILGLLKEKTRVIVTRNELLFYHADQIHHVENGKVTPNDYMIESIDLSFEDNGEVQEEQKLHARRNSVDPDDLHNASATSKETAISDSEEFREYGNISTNVFSCYWKAIQSPLASTVLIFVVLMQLSRNLSDAWLAHWVTDTTLDNKNQTNRSVSESIVIANSSDDTSIHHTGYYLGIFAGLAGINSILTLGRAFLFAYAGIKAAIFIHDNLLNHVIWTKFSFFDMTSVGRILNRFSSDTYTIDDSLPFILNILLAQLAGLTGALIISLYAMPWLALIIVPMIPIYLNLQHRYRHASRDIKRLSSNALSPLYTHFTETLQGLMVIRTMRASARFQRDFNAKLEESIKAQLTAAAAQQWLGLRLQLLGALLVGSAGLLAAITSAHTKNPGLVGLAISYALSITGLLSGVLNAIAETEQELIAVERVNQYLQLDGEENFDGSADPPFGWPTHGSLMFKNVVLRYHDDSDVAPALRDVSFQTGAFERIAIVGRTGAGKTSILAALMRVIPLHAGEITLDCVNLKTLALRMLRERISLIPQEPFLFEGTIRENLDPRHHFHDSEIWHAVANCPTATLLIQSLGGLNGRLDKGGMNVSAGQKNLLCLARALLKNSKVVCIDEGTSNLDDEAELAMQQALRNAFKRSTIIYIAHRLKGLHLMDKVIVMEHGNIKEMGPPSDLARKTDSLFHAMLQAQHIDMDVFMQ